MPGEHDVKDPEGRRVGLLDDYRMADFLGGLDHWEKSHLTWFLGLSLGLQSLYKGDGKLDKDFKA